jgi:DNA-binding MarR family transcriptional regulator
MVDKLDWKQIEMLAYIYQNEDCISADIGKDLRITYSHVHKFLHILAAENIIVYDEKDGRTRTFRLTKEGRELAFRCYNLVSVLESIRG